MKNKHVKIVFELNPEDDWPPFPVESLWALDLGESRYQLDNTPFYKRGVSYKDIVIAIKNAENVLYFQEFFKESGHSTIRVFIFDETYAKEIEKQINALNCSFEKYNATFFAIDIPPEVDLDPVLCFLRNATNEGLLEYEEGCLSDHHKKL